MALCRAEIAHLVSSLICCWFETFRWDLKWNVLFETFWNFLKPELLIWNFQMRLEKEVPFETFETWNFSNPSWGGHLFQTFRWDLKWDVLFETFQTFRTHHKSCLFYTFRWLETRYAIWNVWNLKLFKHVMGGCLFETLRWYLKWDVLFETFQNFQPITGVGYLKLSDKTWSEMCYLKLFNLFKPIMRAAYLKLSDETWKRGGIWNFWNLKLFKHVMGGCLFETFRWYLKKRWYLKCLKLETFQTCYGGLLIWNLKWDVPFETFETFQLIAGFGYLKLSDKTWSEICYLKLFNLFKPIMRAAYLKLSDETWNKIFYLKCLKLKTFQTCYGSCLFETFR